MIALTSHELVTLRLALELLDRYTTEQLTKARKQGNKAKQHAMLEMRAHIATVRAKVQAMQEARS